MFTLSEMCEFNHLFITEDIVEGGGFLDYIILRCVLFLFLSLIIFFINFLGCKMSEIVKISQSLRWNLKIACFLSDRTVQNPKVFSLVSEKHHILTF